MAPALGCCEQRKRRSPLQESSGSILLQLEGKKESDGSSMRGRDGNMPAKPKGGRVLLWGRRRKKKKPDSVCANLRRWAGSDIRARHDRETHLMRQSDLAGSRERISTTRS